MNNQHMKIQMHKQLEKVSTMLVSAGWNHGQPAAQVVTKLLQRKEQSDNLLSPGINPECCHES